MKNITILVILMLSTHYTYAQSSYTLPKYKFDTKADYKKYEQDIVACVNYMESTPIQSEPEKGQNAAQFVMDWADGNPNVTVPINPQTVSFIQTGPFMLVYYVAGYCRYYIENGGKITDVDGVVAGLTLVTNVYTNHKLDDNQDLAKLVKLKEEGKLKEHVEQLLSNFPKE